MRGRLSAARRGASLVSVKKLLLLLSLQPLLPGGDHALDGTDQRFVKLDRCGVHVQHTLHFNSGLPSKLALFTAN